MINIKTSKGKNGRIVTIDYLNGEALFLGKLLGAIVDAVKFSLDHDKTDGVPEDQRKYVQFKLPK